VEVGGNKSVVFCGGSTYKVSMCSDHRLPFRGYVKNPVSRSGVPPNSLATSSHVGPVMDLYLKFVTRWYTKEFTDHGASHENRQHNRALCGVLGFSRKRDCGENQRALRGLGAGEPMDETEERQKVGGVEYGRPK
jgi:hypothetical protein